MKRKELIIIIVLLLLGIFSRFYLLENRVLHNDEATSYLFADRLIDTGRYEYDPFGTYHGPFYFFMVMVSFLIFGVSEFSLRLPAVLIGVGLVMFPLMLKRKRYGGWVVSVFLLLSPALIYYSRYSIPEIVFAFFSLASVYFFSLILKTKDLDCLALLAICLAVLFVTKETVVILGFVLFVLGIVNFKRVRGLDWREKKGVIIISLVIFVFIYIGFFSSFGNYPEGIGDSFRAYFPNLDRGVEGEGHAKPFYYYLKLMFIYEWPILLFGLIGIYYSFKKENRRDVFVLNNALWLVLVFLVYSFIPYKTPWLIVNLIVPMCFVAGFGYKKWKVGRGLKRGVLVAGIVYLVFMGVYVNFVKPWQEENRYAYVHTDMDIFNLLDELRANYGGGSGILMVSKKYWPLPYYFERDWRVNYLNMDEDFEGYGEYEGFDLYIVDSVYFDDYEIPGGFEVLGDYRLHESTRLYLVRGV